MSIIIFISIMAGFSVVIHQFVRKPIISLPLLCLLGGLVNLVDEILHTTGPIRPADVAFWGSMSVMIGAVISFPIAALVWWVFYKPALKTKS